MILDFWTQADLADSAAVSRLLQTVSREIPDWFPTKWGDSEPFEVFASVDDFSAAVDFWINRADDGAFLSAASNGRKSSVLVNFASPKPDSRALHHQLFLSLKMPKAERARERLLARCSAIFREWCEILDADFARMCLEPEWIRRNVIEQFRNPDGSITAWKVFCQHIAEGLPGVYWQTFFGASLSEWLGRDRLAANPWPDTERLGDGYLLRRSESPLTWQEESTLDNALIQHLGSDRFFDKEHYESHLEAYDFGHRPPSITPTPSGDVRTEQDKLLDAALNAATQLLQQRGEFLPFGVTLSPDGRVVDHQAYNGDQPQSSEQLIDGLVSAFADGAKRNEFEATAIVFDAKVNVQGVRKDAIAVDIEHRRGDPVKCFLPYDQRNGQFHFGEVVADKGESRVFDRIGG